MPPGSPRRAWLLRKDAEVGTRAAAEAGRSAAVRGTAVSPRRAHLCHLPCPQSPALCPITPSPEVTSLLPPSVSLVPDPGLRLFSRAWSRSWASPCPVLL